MSNIVGSDCLIAVRSCILAKKSALIMILRAIGGLFFIALIAGCSQLSQAHSKNIVSLRSSQLQVLDPQLHEISGLAETDAYYWGVNDSGGKAVLYGFDKKTAKLAQVIELQGAINIDWEELAQDQQFLYIADSGDNFAMRQSIDIYKVAIQDLALFNNSSNASNVGIARKIASQVIHVKYADKDNFLPQKKHNFDSEALTVVGDKLWLFSKNRQDQQTKLYKIDKQAKQQILAPTASYPVQGLITAADYNAATEQLILLGYSKKSLFGGSFIWVLDVKDDLPLWSSATRYKLKRYAQWESIKWLTKKGFIVAAEKSSLGKQAVAKFVLP